MSAVMHQDKLKALLAELAKDIKAEKDLGALTQQLIKPTVETALSAELDEHLGYDKHEPGSGWAWQPMDARTCIGSCHRMMRERISSTGGSSTAEFGNTVCWMTGRQNSSDKTGQKPGISSYGWPVIGTNSFHGTVHH